MTLKNSYALLSEFKNYIRSRGGTVPDDATDDGVIEDLLVSASRYLDEQTQRYYYPTIDTTYYDTSDDRNIYFDLDVLEVLTLTNGDGTSIASTEYNLIPKNLYAKFGLSLKEASSVTWQADSSGNNESVITLLSLNGYHQRYGGAWETVTTLAEDLDTSEVAIDLTSGTNALPGHIWRVDNEIGIVDSKATNTITVATRPQNGSTAATHTSGTAFKVWRPMEEAKIATLEIANNAYRRRFGQVTAGTETVTASGVVLAPKDVPPLAMGFIKTYRRLV